MPRVTPSELKTLGKAQGLKFDKIQLIPSFSTVYVYVSCPGSDKLISVKPYSLNRYAELKLWVEDGILTGEYIINEKKILADWRKAGKPRWWHLK